MHRAFAYLLATACDQSRDFGIALFRVQLVLITHRPRNLAGLGVARQKVVAKGLAVQIEVSVWRTC